MTTKRLGSFRIIQLANHSRNHLSYAKSQRLSVLLCPFCSEISNERDTGLEVGNKQVFDAIYQQN